MAIDLRTHDIFKIMFDNDGKTTFKFESDEENDISIEPVIKPVKLSQTLNIETSKESDNEKRDRFE